MTTEELLDIFNKGIRPVIKFNENIEDVYSQFERNMLANIVDIREDAGCEELYEVIIDEIEFKKYNISLETPFCRDEETGEYVLKWSEIHERVNVDILYIEKNKDIFNFELAQNSYSELVREFLDSGTDLNYLDWLQEKVFELRALLDL